MGRHLSNENSGSTKQLDMIRGEVEKSDRILTELMGYARLSEGRIEKINVKEELLGAISEVFPPSHMFPVEFKKNVSDMLPPLMMQRAHLREVMVNLLVNAREAAGGGQVAVSRAMLMWKWRLGVALLVTGR